MKKSTIIATCLLNSRMTVGIEQGEGIVEKVFREDYPNKNYLVWNADVDDFTAQTIIRNVGVAMTINVPLFIKDLS